MLFPQPRSSLKQKQIPRFARNDNFKGGPANRQFQRSEESAFV
jgi:hypothetical protein